MKNIIREFVSDIKGLDWRLLTVAVSGAIFELLIRQLSAPVSSQEFTKFIWAPFPPMHFQFYSIVNSALIYYLFYLILPLIIVLMLYRGGLRSFGLGFGDLRRYLPVYAVLFLLLLPLIIAASFQEGFRETYPFMRVPVLSLIIIWEVIYFVQFLCVEFFFRGFLLFPFCRRFGMTGILVHIIPYCLIHIDKPIPEALGSIITGLLLGYFAWRSGSIWGGVFLHGLAALIMDIMAMMMR